MTKKELEQAIKQKTIEIEEKQKEIDCWEADNDDYEDQYCECLNSQGDIIIGSLHYTPSMVLKEVDPTAYRCGLNDYVDGLDLTPNELNKELEALEDELEELEEELNEE